MDPVEESDDDQHVVFEEYIGHIADGHGPPQMNDDMWDDVYNDYMGDDDDNGSYEEDYLHYFLDHSYSYDSDDRNDDDYFNSDDEYFTWEEDSPELEDFHLTDWSGPARPGQMFDDQMEDSTPANSLIGPSWGRIKAARLLMPEDLREKEQVRLVSYEQVFTLVVHTEKMMAAWKKRMEKTGISWKTNRESFRFTANRETDTEEAVKEAEDALGNLKLNGTKNEETEPEVIYTEPTTASERVQYSVEKLVDMLGSSLQLDELSRNINELKNWVQKHLMESVNSCLPLSLPYPALAVLFKSLYSSSESSHDDVTPQLGFINAGDPENLVEEKYLVRLYLSLADVYNVFREIMFRRPTATCRKDFKQKFKLILSRIEPNFSSIKALHDQSTNESNCPVASGPTKQTFYYQNETISPVTEAALFNKFIVTIADKANPSNGQLEMKPDIKIVNTETNQIEKEFSLEIEPHSKDLSSKGLIYRNKTTISVAKNLILYGVLFTNDDDDGDTWPSVKYDTMYVLCTPSYVWRWVVVNWNEARVIHDMIVPKDMSKMRGDFDMNKPAFYPPKVSLSKFGTNIWILEESRTETEEWDEIDWVVKKFLRIYEAGNENSKAIFENSNIVDLRENFVVISMEVVCDDEKLTCIKWINLLTLEVFSEDLYRQNKEPTICFDKNDHVMGESIKFVQVNESGKTDIWNIEQSGRKEILLRLEHEVELTKFKCQSERFRYFHPHLLCVSNTENISDDYRVLSSAKITVHDLKENASPANVIFLNTSRNRIQGFYAYSFHTFQYPNDIASFHIDLDGNSVVIMTKQKKRIDNFYNYDEKDLSSKWSRFEFSKAESAVMAEDIKSATNILRKIESEKILVHESAMGEPVVHSSEIGDPKDQLSGACGWLDPRGWASNQTFKNRNIQDFSKNGERIVGKLIDWDGSSGFLRLDSLENSPKISLHIANIRNPNQFVEAGIEFEVSVTENTNGKYYEAVEAEALNERRKRRYMEGPARYEQQQETSLGPPPQAFQMLQEENSQLRLCCDELEKRVSDLTATNEFLLDQNAQLRMGGKNPAVSGAPMSRPHPGPPGVSGQPPMVGYNMHLAVA